MAKKRFKNVGKDIFQYGGWYCSAGGEHCADVIATALNELIEENKQLKEENEEFNEELMEYDSFKRLYEKKIERLEKENEQLKEGMIGVVDRYIRNVEHNPPSSVRTYLKVKGALVNVREGLKDLLEDLND